MKKASNLISGVPLLALMLLTLLASLLPQQALANDAALYGPSAPPGSAFVRVFNAQDQPETQAQLGEQKFEEVASWGSSEFLFVPAGSHPLKVGSASKTVQLQADRYYTAVVNDGQLLLLDSSRYNNRMKALVIVYNLSEAKSLSLRTADGRTPLVDNVTSKGQGSREVNPAKASLAVFDGDRRLGEAPPVNLSRGKAFSLFVVGDASAPRLVWAIN